MHMGMSHHRHPAPEKVASAKFQTKWKTAAVTAIVREGNAEILDRKGGLLDNLFQDNMQVAMHGGKGVTKQEKQMALREILIYMCFITVFTMTQAKGLFNPTIYQFGAAIKGQLLDSELMPEHAPNLPKTFMDCATVTELYQWMAGPFASFVFTTASYDGGASFTADGMKAGHALGHGRFIGPVRVSQVRANKLDCSANVWSKFPKSVAPGGKEAPWECYDGGSTNSFGGYDLFSFKGGGFENTSDFGDFGKFNYTAPRDHHSVHKQLGSRGEFKFDGVDGATGLPLNGSDVAKDRSRFFSSFVTTELAEYPYPAFHVTFDPNSGDAGIDQVRPKPQT